VCRLPTILRSVHEVLCAGLYRVIHNPLTHFIKLVHLNGSKDCNMQPTDGKRNSPFRGWGCGGIPYKCSIFLPFEAWKM
jgi:hypothetical protein